MSAAAPVVRQARDQRLEVERVEDLPRVALDVLGRQLGARALADALAGVLGVLELAQLGGGRELLHVPVVDARVRECGLEAGGVGPRVLAPADSPPLAHVDEQPDVGVAERLKKALGVESVHADRRNHAAEASARVSESA